MYTCASARRGLLVSIIIGIVTEGGIKGDRTRDHDERLFPSSAVSLSSASTERTEEDVPNERADELGGKTDVSPGHGENVNSFGVIIPPIR